MTNLENVPDFISNPIRPEQNVGSQRGFISTTENVPDFIQPNRSINFDDIEQPNRLNTTVSQELWIDLDKEWSSDLNAVKTYVDSLSDEDYKTWTNLKNEWYSLEARKALMDNQDLLYDIKETWNKKFYSWNQSVARNALMDLVQDSNLLYEDTIHPWSVSAQDWLNEKAMNLDEKYSRENMYWKNIERIDPYNNTENNLVKLWQIYSTSVVSNLKREGIVLAKMGIQLASLWVNFFDNLINLNLQAQANLVNPSQEKIDKYGYEPVVIDQDKRATTLGSYLQMVEDVFWVWFVAAYPVASFIFTELADSSPTADSLLSLVNWWFEKVAEKMMDIGFIYKRADNNLSESDKEYLKRDIAQWLFIVTTAIMWWGWKKFSQTEMYKNWETSLRLANEFWKKWANESLQRGKAIRDIIWEQPTWTELLNNKGKPIAVSTENGWQLTPRGSLNVLFDAAGSYWKSFKEAFNWRWRNKSKWLVTRDPNAPVWELPWVPMVDEKTPVEEVPVEEKPTEEIKPKEEVKIEDLEEAPKPNLRKAVPKVDTSKWTPWEWIWSFIKKIANTIAGTEWWLNQELITKLQNSIDLQNEYVNTIDPYLRANWTENPSWVIKDQLADFVQTAKDQLDLRRWRNQDFRTWQMKYRTEIPDYEKAQRKAEDLEIKNLIKILSKSQDNPEKFLKYLLNLPKEKVQNLEKYIPDFSKNLGIIQDTLEITKAITKPDLVDKFLKFKSTRWTRNKKFIRKYIYKKLSEAYKRAWVKRNMYEIEQMLNQLSEEDLVELEEAMSNDNIPAYMKQDFINNLYDKLDKNPMEAIEWKKIGETTIQLSKKNKENIIDSELTKQWYRRQNDTTPEYKTEEELRQHKLPDWTTIWEWMDRARVHLSPSIFKDFRFSEADFWNKAINYNINGFSMSSFVAWHEIAHFILGKLTTSELFDLTERIRELTKDSSREINRVWMWEYLADTISNYLNHGDVDWLENLLTKNLEGPKKEITEHIQNLLDNFKKDKLYQERAPRYENPRNQGWITAWERMDFLRNVDSNLKDYSFDLDVDSPTFSEMRFNMKDWKSLSWEEWKDTLSHDQYLKLYSSEDLFNLEKEIKNQSNETSDWKNDIKKEIKEAEAYFGEKKYEKYQKKVKDIDPDIIWLVEKDWEIYVKYLMESQRERYELPDRPWYVEVKEVPVKDYFTEEELKQLPKDLQKIIQKDAD